MNITDDVHPDILPNGLSIATYTSDSKNAPSSYGTVLYMSYNNSGNKWYSAIAFPTESSYIFFLLKQMKKIGLIGLLNSKAKSGIIYGSPVTFKLSNSSIYILICAHSSGKPVISVFTTYDNKILHTQLSEPSFAKIEVSGMNVIVTAQYTHIYSLVKVS